MTPRRFVAGFLAGGLVVGLLSLLVFYERTAKQAFAKVARLLDRDEQSADPMESMNAFVRRVPSRTDQWRGVPAPDHPAWLVRAGYNVELVAKGFTYPVNIAFVPIPVDPAPDHDEDAPWFYVNELHGSVKYVTRSGKIVTFASELKNFPPTGRADTEQTGLSGLVLIPGTEDLLVTTSYQDAKTGLLKSRILRLVSKPGGKELQRAEVFFDFDEFTAPSHQIHQVFAGQDGKLYVCLGDAENWELSQSLDRWGGKILRMNMDGTACTDNPFYDDKRPDHPRSFTYAWGLRNVFDMAQEPVSGRLYGTDNGFRIDRLIEIEAGRNYGWNGHPDSTRANALFTWGPFDNPAPVGCLFLQQPVLGASKKTRLFVATFGRAFKHRVDDKALLEFSLDPQTGRPTGLPDKLVQGTEGNHATIVGLAEGPDGVYFTDFFGQIPQITVENAMGQGAVWRVFPDNSTKSIALNQIADGDDSALEQGYRFFYKNCLVCHRFEGNGGFEGPELTNLLPRLTQKLNSRGYQAEARRYLEFEGDFFAENRYRIEEVLQAQGRPRVRRWLHHHLEEPRFDNRFAKMPSFQKFDLQQRQHVISFLMTTTTAE